VPNRAFAWALSLPHDDERARAAARRLLEAPDPSALLRAVYPMVMGQKGLRAMLGHLERAGADLGALSLPTALVRATFPLNRRQLWPVPSDKDWALIGLAQVLAQHRRLLWEVPQELARRTAPDRFVLLSGRAMEALYPTYDARLGFDTDIWAAGLADGLELLEVLIRRLGFNLEHARLENVWSEARLAAGVSRQVDGFDVSVGVMAGGHHFYREALHQRSIAVEWELQPLRAPSPEDLLVMLAISVRKKRCIQMTNVVDAMVILRTGRPLDLTLVQHLALTYRVEVPLTLLLAHSEAIWPGTVPGELMALVSGVPRLQLALSRRVLQAPQDHPLWLWEKAVFEIAALRSGASPAGWGHIVSVLARRSSRRVVRWQNRLRKRLGIAPTPLPTRTPGLPLCGAASAEITAALPRCVGGKAEVRWRHRVPRNVRDAADRLLALTPAESHRCRTLRAVGES
jgi:hypothetical protein